MSFKEKLEKAFKNKIGDFTGVQWKDLDHKKVYMAGGGLVLLIALVVALLMGGIEGKDNKEQKPGSEQTQIEVTPEVTEEVVEDALKTDAFPEINALVEKYFQGLSSGDTAMVAETVDVLTDEEKQVIERKKDYIEAYNNVVCYTKSGLEEESYVVFASYEMKIYNIETAAPGIMALYVCKGDDGSYYIFNGETPEELENYVLELAAEEEVRAVISEVDARYQKLVKEDEDLKKFSETMLQSQKEEQPGEEPEAPVDENDSQATAGEPKNTVVTDNVRLREGRSTDSTMLETLASGTGVKVLMNYADGWSKIEYNDMTGYCKTEFLENTEGVPTENAQQEQPKENTEAETTETETTETETTETETETTTEVTPVNKQMQFKEAVRIREGRSADTKRLTNAYEKELVMVIENYSDGWSKVNYNDIVGYCKTEFLEPAK